MVGYNHDGLGDTSINVWMFLATECFPRDFITHRDSTRTNTHESLHVRVTHQPTRIFMCCLTPSSTLDVSLSHVRVRYLPFGVLDKCG